MAAEPEWVSLGAVVVLNRTIVAASGERLRDRAALEAAIGRPRNIWAYFIDRDCAVLAAALMAALSWGPPGRAQQLAAQGEPAAWYVGGESGWAHLADEPAKAVIPVYGPRDDNERWDSGFDAGLRAGYAWAGWRLEGEFRYQHNAAATFSGASATGGATSYAVMTNLLYEFATGWPVTPHIGAGIGLVALQESIKTAGFFDGVVHGSDALFGYQAIGGLSYAISPSLAIDLDYRYLATAAPQFRTPPGFVDGGVPAGNLPLRSGYHTHDLVASLIYRFGAAQ